MFSQTWPNWADGPAVEVKVIYVVFWSHRHSTCSGAGEDGFELHQLRMILSCEMSSFLHQLVSQMHLSENSCLQLLGERDWNKTDHEKEAESLLQAVFILYWAASC